MSPPTPPAISPRLMNRAEAKAYCRGVDPHHICAPLMFGRRLLWDRLALDEALNELGRRRKAEPPSETDGADLIDDELARAQKRIAKGALSER